MRASIVKRDTQGCHSGEHFKGRLPMADDLLTGPPVVARPINRSQNGNCPVLMPGQSSTGLRGFVEQYRSNSARKFSDQA